MSTPTAEERVDPQTALRLAEARNAALTAELQRATEQAAQARQQLHTLADNLPVGMLCVAADQTVESVNALYFALLGLDDEAADWLGQPAAGLRELVGRHHTGPNGQPRTTNHDDTLVLPDGRVLRRNTRPLPTGGYLEHLHDITREDLDEGMLAAASIPEQSPYPMLRYSLSGEALYANPAAWRLRQQLSPEEQHAARQRYFAEAAEAVQTGEARQLELQIGPAQYVAYIVPFAAEGYFNLYLLDITERRHAQDLTRVSEARLQQQQQFTQHILDTIPSTVVVRTCAGQELFSNRAFRDLMNQSLRTEEAAMEQYRAAVDRVLRTGRDEAVRGTVILHGGEVRWLLVELRRLARPDDEAAILVVSTDVTALTEAQHELARNERRYNELMDYAQALIWTHDLNGRILSANPALSAMLGLGADTIVGRPLQDAFDEDRHAAVTEYLRLIRAQGEFASVVKLRDQLGGLHYVQQYSRLVDEPGEEAHVMAFGHEITERVLAQRATQQAKEAAEAAATARANFLANMSHEIRTPLNGVLGMATLLGKTSLDSRQSQYLDVIRSSGQHLLGVINDVLDIAKISSGKVELEQSAFNLCDSMGGAIQPLVLQAAQKGITFSGTPLRTSCAYPWIIGDPHRLNQILINLTANAVKFTDAGGHVEVVGEQLSETDTTLTVRFRVTDTGPGIPAERLGRIFDSFTQAYADTSRQHGGTGLGLTISRALVEQMGGQLTVESELGRGSTFAFVVTLPKAERGQLPATPAGPVSVDTGALRGKRVLLVEDNEINRDVARLLLEEWGVTVDEAVNGEAGVRQFYAQPYDAVLMDIQMPGMNGLEATARLLQHPDAPRAATPIVALTANAFREDNEQYLAAGMTATLAKPFEEADLYRVLTQVLARPTAPAPAYDLRPLRDMARGKDAFVTKIVRSFLLNMPESLQELEAAAAAGRWPEVARTVHHIKPNLTALRVSGVDAPVAQLEQFRHDVPVHLPDHELRASVAQLVSAVRRALRELPREVGE